MKYFKNVQSDNIEIIQTSQFQPLDQDETILTY